MAKVRFFISYDYDNDAFLKEALVEQSKKADSPFEFTDASVKVHLTGDWKEKVEGRIGCADQVAVICGKHTDKATGVDHAEIVDAVHVPENAGEHEPALRRLLLRIPDGWGRWISCSPGWFALLARAEDALAVVCPTFTAHQIKEKFGTLRLYVEFDHDDDLPTELRAAEPQCPSFEELAGQLGTEGAHRDGPVGAAWRGGHETIFVPAYEEWAARVTVFRESDAGKSAAEDQARRSAEFERLVETFEKESATVCDRCGGHGLLSRSGAAMPWYAVRCDKCRDAGWTPLSDRCA